MNYTKSQITKLLIERDITKRICDVKELAQLDAELDLVFATQERGFIDAARAVYQEES